MKRLSIFILLLFSFFFLGAQSRRIAFMNMDNVNGDPQYDYLEGIVRGILLFDLGGQDEIDLVVRSELDAVMAEQKLALSGMVQNDAIRVGELLSADYLISGEYIFLGQDVMVNLSLIEVVNGKSTAYRTRGDRENSIHSLAEEIILDILGYTVELQGPMGDRSILSFEDVSPGSIALFSPLINGEIYFDEEFIGYTTGDGRTPYNIENITPGLHTLGVYIPDFGVIKKPEWEFIPYEVELQIEAGKRLTLRPEIYHFNDWISRERFIFDKDWVFRNLAEEETHLINENFEFIDRLGETVEMQLQGELFNGQVKKHLTLTLFYEGEPLEVELFRDQRIYVGEEAEIGKVLLEYRLHSSYLEIRVQRMDIWQGMF